MPVFNPSGSSQMVLLESGTLTNSTGATLINESLAGYRLIKIFVIGTARGVSNIGLRFNNLTGAGTYSFIYRAGATFGTSTDSHSYMCSTSANKGFAIETTVPVKRANSLTFWSAEGHNETSNMGIAGYCTTGADLSRIDIFDSLSVGIDAEYSIYGVV